MVFEITASSGRTLERRDSYKTLVAGSNDISLQRPDERKERMRTIGKLALAASLIAGIGAATVAQAHGIWFAQRSNQLALIYGIGADDLDAVKRLPKVKAVAAYDEDGKEVQTQLAPNGPLLVVNTDNQPAIVAAVLDNGLWSKTADGKWHNKGKDEVPDATVSEHTFKYAVHLRRPLSAALPVLPAHKLQIVPVAKELPEQMGQPLTLRVLYEGKPVRGARVQPDFVNDPDSEPLKTGADGTVMIKVRNQGLNVIVAVFESPPAEPAKTNRDEHLATLSFVLPHLPE
jgi:nickel transport protein